MKTLTEMIMSLPLKRREAIRKRAAQLIKQELERRKKEGR